MHGKKRSSVFAKGRAWAIGFCVSGAVALLCIPSVFVLEALKLPDDPANLTGWIAVLICLGASIGYLRQTRGSRENRELRAMAKAALWLSLSVIILLFIWIAFLAVSAPDID